MLKTKTKTRTKQLTMFQLMAMKQDSAWREAVRKKDNYTCTMCYSTEKLHAHHIWPKARFAHRQHDPSNGILLCESCHRSIQGKEMEFIPLFIMYRRAS